MKINVDGVITELKNATIKLDNRAFFVGDTVSEVLRLVNGEIVDWEDHYFNLMASMRIFRMNIPLDFTPEFFQAEIHRLAQENTAVNGRIVFFVYRQATDNLLKAKISYMLQMTVSTHPWEYITSDDEEIDVYKDYAINQSFYSLVNTHRPEEQIAEIYRLENGYADLVLLNPQKRMARTLKGAIFVIKDQVIKTPKKEEGALSSVLRNRLIKKLNEHADYSVEETDIFPFEMQKADEVFVLIDGVGILSITQNRKKQFASLWTQKIVELL